MADVCRIEVELRDVRPRVWRRLLVSKDTTLGQLHRILQAAMGWHDTHLHHFVVGNVFYGSTERRAGFERRNERDATLGQVAPHVRARVVYEYDFGDGWVHDLTVEAMVEAEPATKVPTCEAGARACPPEDCGGPSGYEELLAALADPAHPEHASMSEWLGRPFDPAAFDLAAVNRRLSRIR